MSPDSPNAKLFINYRREDTAAYAGRLYDRLVAHFGVDQVFMDIDQIEPGEDFVEVINRKVGACEIAIISIGPNWLSAKDAAGQRRLDDEEDFVRTEIVAALERKIRVIPVLVGGARMPRKQDLPEALAPLSRRNAIELSETRFHADVSRLIEAIEKPRAFPEKKAEPSPAPVAPITEPAPPVKMADAETFPEKTAVRPSVEPSTVSVALKTETEPPVKLSDPESLPETSELGPPTEPPPVPVALITETAPPIKMADPENLPKTSELRPPAETISVPAALTTKTASPAKLPDPENLQKTSAPRPPAGPDRLPNPPTAPRSQTAVATTEKRRLAWILGDLAPRSQARPATAKTSKLPWILGGLGFGALLLFVLFMVVVGGILQKVSTQLQQSLVQRLEYNGGDLSYTSNVTETEAKKLGDYLVKAKYFAGKPCSVKLDKTGTTYEVRLCIKTGTENQDSTYYKNVGDPISLNVFDGSPVVVHLSDCNENWKTLRVITP